MSFLVPEDDPLATLQVALAFIDACEGDEEEEEEEDSASVVGSVPDTTSACSTGSSEDDAPPAAPASHDAASHDATSLKVFIRRTPSGRLLSEQTIQLQQRVVSVLPQKSVAKAPTGMTSNRAKSGKKHRERKKNEMLTLREQVNQLEASLAHLRRVVPRTTGRLEAGTTGGGGGGGRSSLHLLLEARISSPNTSESERNEAKSAHRALQALQPVDCDATAISGKPASGSTTPASWLDVAAMQARERYASEALNLRLKEALQKQMQMTQALQSILGRTRAEGLDQLLSHQRDELTPHVDDRLRTPLAAASAAELLSVMDRLYAGMHQMYISTDSVIGKQGEADWTGAVTPSSSSRVTQGDVTIGMCVELTSSTLLHCAFEEAGRVVWQLMSQIKQADKHPGKPRMKRQDLTSDSFVMSHPLVLGILGGEDQQPLELQCTSYMRKFGESNRFMVMWYSTVILSNSGLQFTEKGWVVSLPCLKPVANPIDEDTAPKSTVVKTCHQVSCAPQDPEISQETKELIALVLQTLSRKTREYHQLMQDLLLDQFSSTT